MDADEVWIGALVRTHHDDLLRFATHRVGRDAAPDVVGEVFLVAWRRRSQVPEATARLWLFGVANRVIANERRGRERRGRLVERVASELATTSTEDARPSRVLDALAELPEHEQEALRLVEWDGLALDEAAAVAGCSNPTFRVRLHRARRRLAQRLEAAIENESRPMKDVTA